jgi:hypothetical protein
MKKIFAMILLVLLFSCIPFPYVYYDQKDVLIKGVDIDKTLDVAQMELESGGTFCVLGVWVIRDQIINNDQAKRISDLYFKYIDTIKDDFDIWHLSWAISNYYRNGNDEIKAILKDAYNDAVKRPEKLHQFKSIANELINGSKVYMGNIHDLGKAYAHSHIVVPGNTDYIQSVADYQKMKDKQKSKGKTVKK